MTIWTKSCKLQFWLILQIKAAQYAMLFKWSWKHFCWQYITWKVQSAGMLSRSLAKRSTLGCFYLHTFSVPYGFLLNGWERSPSYKENICSVIIMGKNKFNVRLQKCKTKRPSRFSFLWSIQYWGLWFTFGRIHCVRNISVENPFSF